MTRYSRRWAPALTELIHEFDEINETDRSVENGWNPILSGLKTYLETDEPLGVPLPGRVRAS